VDAPTAVNRVVIVSGGSLGDWVLDSIADGDHIIGADAGALFLVRNGIKPDLSLGDFDSVSPEEQEEVRAGSLDSASFDPIDKNYTDTELALLRALELKPASIVLLGATGSRLDHTLSNIHLLRLAAAQGIPAAVEDAANRVRLLPPGNRLEISKSRFNHVSLLPLSIEVRGIDLSGFQYPLHNATLEIGQSLGISNVLAAEVGTVTVSEGWLLVIESIG
jgi:thiamine pyrophosphokinase